MAGIRVLIVALALAALASAAPSARRKDDVTTVVLKTPVPLSTSLIPATDRAGFMTITELGVNVTTNSALFSWELVGQTVFDPKLPAPSSLKIVAYRPNYPITNGATILDLIPAEGYTTSPMWSNFTLAQLNAGRVAAGLGNASLDLDWENGNGTLVINGGDMMYVLTYTDGKSDAGFGSWTSDLVDNVEVSEDLYYAGEVSNTTSLPGFDSWIQPLDFWTMLVSDNEDGTWQGTLFTSTNTSGLATSSVALVALKSGVPVILVDLTTRLNIEESKSGAGSDNVKAFTRAELNAALKANGFSVTTPVLLMVKSSKDGKVYTNVAPMEPEWNVDPNLSGVPAPPPVPKPSPKPVTPTKKPSPPPKKKPSPPPKKKSPPKKKN